MIGAAFDRAFMLFLISFLLCVSFSVNSKPTGSICFTELEDWVEGELVRKQSITFKLEGVEHSIETLDNKINLYKGEALIDELEVNQGFRRKGIIGLSLLSKNLLYVDGYYSDFLIKLKKNHFKPSLELKQFNFENLYVYRPTFKNVLLGLGDFDTDSRAGGFEKTQALKGVFMRGYKYSFFNGWFDWYNNKTTRYLITENGKKELPKEIIEANQYLGDVVIVDPEKDTKHVNGVLFEGKNGQLLFYNGYKVTVLLKDHNMYGMRKNTKDDKSRKVKVFEWRVKQMPNLGPVIYTDRSDKSTVYILTSGPKLLKLAEVGKEHDGYNRTYFKFKDIDGLFYTTKFEVRMITADGVDMSLYKNKNYKHIKELVRDEVGITFGMYKDADFSTKKGLRMNVEFNKECE